MPKHTDIKSPSRTPWRRCRNATRSVCDGKPTLDKTVHGGANASTCPASRRVPMFGLIRTAILLCLAYIGGLFFERGQATDACTGAGGIMRDGVCWNE